MATNPLDAGYYVGEGIDREWRPNPAAPMSAETMQQFRTRGSAPTGWNWAANWMDPQDLNTFMMGSGEVAAGFSGYDQPFDVLRDQGGAGGWTSGGSNVGLGHYDPVTGQVTQTETSAGGGWSPRDVATIAGMALGGAALSGYGAGAEGYGVGAATEPVASLGTEASTVGAGTTGATMATNPGTTITEYGGATGGSGGGWLDALRLGAPIVSSLLQKNASDKANSLQQDAANRALQYQKDITERTYTDTAPWRAAGEAALGKLTGLLNSGELTSKFSGMNPMEEKGYAFTAREGQRAIDARARGAGGDVLRSSTQFAEDNANKHYNDAFNRFQTERTNTTNPLFQMAGFGPQANQQAIQQGSNAADNSSSINLYSGAAAGQNALRTGNIYSNGVNQLAGAVMGGNQNNNNGTLTALLNLLSQQGG